MAALCVAVLLAGCSDTAVQNNYPPLRMPYDVSSSAPPAASGRTQECALVPMAAPEDLVFDSFYDRTDPQHARIDPESHSRYRDQTKALRKFENRLMEMSNRYIQARAPAEAHCVLSWLYTWAKTSALMGQANSQGEFVRQWTLAVVASAYAQIKAEPALNVDQKKLVEAWLADVGEVVMDDYPRLSSSVRKKNNHLYWAAWAVTATGIALDNRFFYDWGVGKVKQAIVEQIENDGTLPLEMMRGSRALLYHVFSLSPLVMVAESAKRNGEDLYELKGGAFHKLVDRVVEAVEDPSYFEVKSGYPQDSIEAVSVEHFAWMEPYHARFPRPDMKKWLEARRPLFSRRLGGNMTLLYKSAGQ